MTLKAGKPSTAKERAIAALQQSDDALESSKPKTKRLNVDLPDTLHRDIKIQAVREGVTLNELTARLFRAYLEELAKNL